MKNKNIHVLPTLQPSRLHFDSKLFISTNHQISREINSIVKGRNIYITSDEEIKEGDWFIFKDDNIYLLQSIGNTDNTHIKAKSNNPYGYGDWNKDYCKKVILTDNKELQKNGVQAIDDEFLEWFVKNPSCENADLIGLRKEGDDYEFLGYEIIIPKEETKQEIELVNGFIPTSFFEKQETLEEVAKRYKSFCSWGCEISFIEGSKWQQERSYSEEEVLNLLKKAHFVEQNIEEWFEQFKKK